ncbi:MAG: S8 family serine peptidase [Clostridia bacterium]
MVVAIVDTGIDNRHEAFSVAPINPKIDQAYVTERLSKLVAINGYVLEAYGEVTTTEYYKKGFTAEQVYASAKIPFQFDYADNDLDAITYGNDHGTHVAGIAAGNNGTDKAVEFRGAAYDAQLLALKVFSDYSGGASTINILAALSDAVTLGVDAVNLSLGSAAGFSNEDFQVPYYNALRDAGVEICIAAGNEYSAAFGSKLNPDGKPLVFHPDFGAVGSPSTYEQPISVASINAYQNSAGYLMLGETKLPYNEIPERFFYQEIYDMNPTLASPAEVEYVVIPKLGSIEGFKEVDVKGKIALVQRGDLTFSEKVQNAADAGAMACIIYDNVDGPYIRMAIDKVTIPGMFMYLKDGKAMADAPVKKLTLDKTFFKLFDYEMSDFSCWGPTSALTIKPEITAPGGQIHSATTVNDKGESTYILMSGTSMATPNFAGASVLIKEYVNNTFPTMTAKEKGIMVYKLAMSTANIIDDLNGIEYSPRKQGAGLVDVTAATTTKAYINVPGQEKTKIELGDDPDYTGIFDLGFEVVNFGDKALSYFVDTTVLTEAIDMPFYALKAQDISRRCLYEVTVENGTYDIDTNEIVVEAGTTAKVNVNIVLSEADKAEMETFIGYNGGNFVEGFVVLENSTDEIYPNLSVPFMGFYGDWTNAAKFDFTIYDGEDAGLTQTYSGIMWGFLDAAGRDLPMGDFALKLPEGVTAPEADADKIALAPGGDGFSVFTQSYLGLLRNLAEMTYTIEDAVTGEIYYFETYENQRKSVFNDNFDVILPDIQDWNFNTAEAKACYDNLPNNTQLIVTFSGITEFEALHPERESNCWRPTVSLPVYIDNESGTITNEDLGVWKTEDNRIMFSATVYDNHYVMAAWPVAIEVDEAGDPVSVGDDMGDITPVFATEKGAHTKLTWDITDYIGLMEGGYIGVAMYDYALNTSVMVVENIVIPSLPDPTGIEINLTEVELGATQTKQLTLTLLPLNYGWDNDYTVNWTSMDTNVATVNGFGRVKAVSEGTTTIIANVMWTNDEGVIKNLQTYCTVKVKPEPKKIIASDMTLKINEVGELKYSFEGENIYTPNGKLSIAFKDPAQTVASYIEGAIKGIATGETFINISYTYVNGFGKDVVLSTDVKITVTTEVYDGVYIPTSVSLFYMKDGVKTAVPFSFYAKVGDVIDFIVEVSPSYAEKTMVWNVGIVFEGEKDFVTFDGNKVTCVKPGDAFVYCRSTLNNRIYDMTNIMVSAAEGEGGGEGEGEIPAEGEFVVSETGVLEKYNGVGGDIVIPNGVVEIANKVFQNKKITSVKFPEGLKKIGLFAFNKNKDLTVVELPEGITHVEIAAFAQCGLTTLTLPTSLTYIGKLAFALNANLEFDKLVLHEGLTYVGSLAFGGSNVNTIVIPTTLVGVDFGTNQMTNNDNVVYEITKGNPVFTQTEDAIIDIHGNYLRYQGANKFVSTVVNIPDGIVRIGAGAFYKGYDTEIAIINVPASVQSIGDLGLYGFIAIVNFAGDAPILESEDDQPDYGYANFFTMTNVYYQEGAVGFNTKNWTDQVSFYTVLSGKKDMEIYTIEAKLQSKGTGSKEIYIEDAVIVEGFAEPWAQGFETFRAIIAVNGQPVDQLYVKVAEFDRPLFNDEVDLVSPIIFFEEENMDYNTTYGYYAIGWKIENGVKVYGEASKITEITTVSKAALAVDAEIEKLVINSADETALLAVEAKFAALNAKQQAEVKNVKALEAARVLVEVYKLNVVLATVEAKSIEDEANIIALRALVDAVAEENKAVLTNLDKLVIAEKDLIILKNIAEEKALQEIVAKLTGDLKLTLAQIESYKVELEKMEKRAIIAEGKIEEAQKALKEAQEALKKAEEERKDAMSCAPAATISSGNSGFGGGLMMLVLLAGAAVALIAKRKMRKN